MFRKMLFVSGLAVVGIAFWAGVVCPGQTAGQADKSRAQKAAPYVHAVIFHIKKDAPEGEAAARIVVAGSESVCFEGGMCEV
jgi:hypothetical protein